MVGSCLGRGFGDSMPDLTIPGVSTNVDTQKMIEALMKPERAKVDRKKAEVDELKNQKKVGHYFHELGVKGEL